MKKIISMILLIAILVLSCACGKEQAAEPTVTAPIIKDETKMSPEEMYGHIDQTVPVDGVYQLWNPDGVMLIAQHPDAKFKLLCTIDMGGAVVEPIAEFTGELEGEYFTLKNFTVQAGSGENLGLFGVNKGKVTNVYLDSVTLIPNENTKNMGAMAGVNEGELIRSIITASTMNVEKAAANAACGGIVGTNSGTITNVKATVKMTYTAPGKATIGGIAGVVTGGTLEFLENHGALTVTGEDKTLGLLAGDLTGTVLTQCVFGGDDNSYNGKLFKNMTGNEDDDENVTTPKALYRVNDHHAPLTEGQAKLRDRVVEEMNAMGTFEWRLHADLVHSCTCALAECHGVYNTTTLYIGVPYNHKGGSLARMQYAVDEEGYIKDWLYTMDPYDGFDLYIGNDCSTAVAHAWWTVSNSTDFLRCTYQVPQNSKLTWAGTGREDTGVIPVGDYEYEKALTGKGYTDQITQATGEQRMYEAYGCIRRGDSYVMMMEAGGHTRMASGDAVVFRYLDGTIDPEYSFVLSSEQGGARTEETPAGETIHTAWRVNYAYTFANLYRRGALPVTCEELLTGEMEPAECYMERETNGFQGMYDGKVKANYFLDSVDLEIKDAKGNVVFSHKMWTTTDKRHDIGENDGGLRNYKDNFDLVGFATPLSRVEFTLGQTYTYTITGNLHTYESFVVKTDSFTYGQV